LEPVRLPDPFAIQADPALYVPRRATEEALDELERSLAGASQGAVCFTGPPGIGKSLLLRVLAAELGERYTTAYLPYARLPAGGLWMCVATELGLEAGRDPKRAVRRLLGELATARRMLLLQVDDASALPAETLYDLLAFARSEPALRLLLTWSDTESLSGPLPDDLPVVRLEAPMTRAETQDYVKARLAGSGAPRALADRFDSATTARLHRESAGNPLRLHGLAVAIARGAAPAAAPAVWTAPAPPEPAQARSTPAPAKAAAPAAAPPPEAALGAPPRAASRRRRRSRSALVGPAWALLGLSIGIAASLLLAEWRRAERAPLAPGAIAERGAPAPEEPAEIPVLPPPAVLGAPSVAGEPPPVGAPPPRRLEAAPPAAAPLRAAEPSPPAARVTPEAEDAGEVASAEAERAAAEREAAEREEAAAAAERAAAERIAAERAAAERAAADRAAAERAAAREAASAQAPAGDAPAPGAPAPRAAPPSEALAAREPAPVAAPPAPAPPVRRPAAGPLAAGRLDVHSDTPVEITIDGRPFGAAPLLGVRLPRGEHRVIAHYPDGGAGLKTIYLSDEDVSVTFR